MLRCFSDKPFGMQARAEFQKLQQKEKETILEFISRMAEVENRCIPTIDENMWKERLHGAVRIEFKGTVEKNFEKSRSAIIEQLLAKERKIRDQQLARVSNSNSQTAATMEVKPEEEEATVAAIQKPSMQANKKLLRCYNSRRLGHMAKDCRSNFGGASRGGRTNSRGGQYSETGEGTCEEGRATGS